MLISSNSGFGWYQPWVSVSEKFIADFLLEHNIAYGYEFTLRGIEPKFNLGRTLKPDFTLTKTKNDKDPGQIDGKNLIIEHWAIDENVRPENEQKPLESNGKAWKMSWKDYHDTMKKKRNFFRLSGKNWIETSPADMVDCNCHTTKREHFENALKEKLQSKGIKCEKLPEKEIINRIGGRHENRILKMFDKFLNQAKKYEMTPNAITKQLSKLDAEEKTRIFTELALEFMSAYEAEMKRRKLIDFDDCIIRAREFIEKTNGNATYDYKESQFRISDLKWIIIDEYQDFSKLFYTLIDAIRQVNPSVNLFCVGDDWQAINGWAGSNLDFFEKFEEKLSPAELIHINKNYRSSKCIVSAGNKLMKYKGTPAQYINDFPTAFVEAFNVNNLYSRTSPVSSASR